MSGACHRRIAIVSHSRARVGGVETYLASIVPALRRAGHEVGCWFETAGEGADPVIAPADGVVSWVASADPDRGLAGLAAWKPDVVYGHGVVSGAYERATMRLAPAVFFAHSYYGTCVSGTKSFRFPVLRTCDRTFGPGCLAEYYPRRCGGWSPVTMARQYQLQRDRLDLLSGYARILVASQHMADEYGRHGLAGSVRVVPLPVDAPPGGAPARPSARGTRCRRSLAAAVPRPLRGNQGRAHRPRERRAGRRLHRHAGGPAALRGRLLARATRGARVGADGA